MSFSTLPLSYCTNVHPGRSVAEVSDGLARFTQPVQQAWGKPLAAGLWLAEPVTRELLAKPECLDRFAAELAQLGLTCYTLNAFPFGDFHSERVKENVYRPDWSDPRRLRYTVDCARILARLMPDGVEGSISTVPLGFKPFDYADDFLESAISQLIALAAELDELHDETGKVIRLAIEPEPFCLLETTPEAIEFFAQLWLHADREQQTDAVQRHIGLCYDVCHQAVEFEDVEQSIGELEAAGVRINKVHITCAVQLDRPGENAAAREALAHYAEPRYLHQTLAQLASGEIIRLVDLTAETSRTPNAELLSADQWRVHFHVPVNAERLGPLQTTRPDLIRALQRVALLPYAPHLEVETYTWEVLPERSSAATDDALIAGLTAELTATERLLDEITRPPKPPRSLDIV